METRLLVAQPDEVVFELKVKATAKEFEMIRDDLDRAKHAVPSWQLVRALEDLLAQARKIYWADSAELDPRVADFNQDRQAAPEPKYTMENNWGMKPSVSEASADVALIFDEHGPAAPAPIKHFTAANPPDAPLRHYTPASEFPDDDLRVRPPHRNDPHKEPGMTEAERLQWASDMRDGM